MSIRRVDRGRNHWYVDTETGERVPSVTSIQRKAIPKQDILVPWAGRMSGDYVLDHWDELAAMLPSERWKAVSGAHKRSNEAAKIRGTKVHVLGAAVAAGEEVNVPAELVGYVEAYTQWLFDWDVNIQHSEAVVWSKTHGNVGTLDTIADLVHPDHHDDRQTWLIDNKTGNSVYDETGFQLTGYGGMDVILTWPNGADEPAVELPMPVIDRYGVVLIHESRYEFREIAVPPYRDFLYLQEAAAAIERNKGCVGEPLDPPIRMEF